jgi:hypothetical protein
MPRNNAREPKHRNAGNRSLLPIVVVGLDGAGVGKTVTD